MIWILKKMKNKQCNVICIRCLLIMVYVINVLLINSLLVVSWKYGCSF